MKWTRDYGTDEIADAGRDVGEAIEDLEVSDQCRAYECGYGVIRITIEFIGAT